MLRSALITTCALAVLAGGCGGDDPKEKAKLVAAADKVCKERKDKTADFEAAARKNVQRLGKKPRRADAQRIQGLLFLEISTATKAANEQLEDIKGPDEGMEKLRGYIRATDGVANTLKEMGEHMTRAERYPDELDRKLVEGQTEARKSVEGYGFKVCGNTAATGDDRDEPS